MDLRASDAEPRKRFSCAHEIIHTVFPGFTREARYRVDLTIGNHRRERYEEEYLCDFGAAELLMPAALLRRPEFDLADRGLDAVEELASRAEVSLEAAGNRLARRTPGALFVVMESMHKPSELPAVSHGAPIPEKLRVGYATAGDGMSVFLPRYKSLPDDSPMVRALVTGLRQTGVSRLPGAGAQQYSVDAGAYPRHHGDRRIDRVLAVALNGATE
jgi:hypothetical protein